MNSNFYSKLQRYIVNSSIDVTVTRPLPAGTLKEAKAFLYATDLAEFAAPSTFRSVLDTKTRSLCDRFPTSVRFPKQSWGHARKCLNIFLRRAIYDHYLRERYHLAALEEILEISLDAQVAQGIIEVALQHHLTPLPPEWDAILRLTPATSDQWQTAASAVARIKDVSRVHLDLWYWQPQQELPESG